MLHIVPKNKMMDSQKIYMFVIFTQIFVDVIDGVGGLCNIYNLGKIN